MKLSSENVFGKEYTGRDLRPRMTPPVPRSPRPSVGEQLSPGVVGSFGFGDLASLVGAAAPLVAPFI